MANGFGNFAGGLAQGIQSGFALNLVKQRTGVLEKREEREEARFKFEQKSAAGQRFKDNLDGVIKFAKGRTVALALTTDLAKRTEINRTITGLRSQFDHLVLKSEKFGALTREETDTKRIAFEMALLPGQTPAQIGAATGREMLGEASALEAGGLTQAQALEAATGVAPEGGGPFGGAGIQADASNIVLDLSARIRNGETLSDSDRATLSLATRLLTAPQTITTPQGVFRTQPQPLDPNLFPSAAGGAAGGGTGKPEEILTKGLSPERAGRMAMISQGVENIRGVRDAIVSEDGTVDRALVLSMVTDIPFAGKGVPFTEGRTIRAQFEDTAAAKLRLETGAQANETEIQNIIDRFLPSLLDSDATIKDKMDRLVAFFETSLSKSDPELFKALTGRARESGVEIPDPPESEPDATFAGFSETGAVFRRPDGTFFEVR